MNQKLRIVAPVGRFFGSGELFNGKGSIGVLATLRLSRVMVLYSNSVFENKFNKTKVQTVLKNIETSYIALPKGEPKLNNLKIIFNELNTFKPDFIVAIGGGSAIDYGKLAWIFYENPDLEINSLTRPFSLNTMRAKAKFIAIPTTAGSGSEVSSVTVFQKEKESSKSFILSHEILPDIAILDPELMIGLPKKIIISSGLDAISHCVEGYVSILSNAMTDDFSEKALLMLFENFENYLENPNDIDLIFIMQRASNYAGIIQNISTPGLAHAIAHNLAGFNIPHGIACGLALPSTIKTNAENEKIKLKYNKLSRILGFRDHLDMAKKLQDLNDTLKIQNYIDQQHIKIKNKDNFIENIVNDPNSRFNPVKLDNSIVSKTIDNMEMI